MQYSNQYNNKTTITDSDISKSYDNTGGVKTTWLNIWNNFLKLKADLLYPSRKASADTQITFWDGNSGELQGDAGLTFDKTQKVVKITSPVLPDFTLDRNGSLFRLYKDDFGLKATNNVLQASGFGRAIITSSNQVLSIPTLNSTSQRLNNISPNGGLFSYSFWFKGTGGSINTGGSVFSLGTTMLLYAGSNNYFSGSYPTIFNGQWHHIVLISQNGGLIQQTFYYLYVDGIKDPGSCFAFISSSNYNNTTNVIVDINGSLDQLLIYNIELSQSNVNTLYNFGAGTFTLPLTDNLRRRFDFEENDGTTTTDSIFTSTASIVNGVGVANWTSGITPSVGSQQVATLIESVDGLIKGERGINRFGEYNGRTVLYGKYLKFQVNENICPVYVDIDGKMLIDLSTIDTEDYTIITQPKLTANLNIGASTTTLAGLRLISGFLNTSNINLGDYNHITSQRTIFKRKGSTTTDSLWLSDSDTHFTQTDTKTVSNTTTPTSIIGTLVANQTLTYPANFWVSGKMEEIEIEGVMSITNTDSFTIDITLGGTNISTSGLLNTGVSTMVDMNFKLSIKIKCETVGATGTFRTTGTFSTFVGTYTMTKVGTTTINTTISQLLDAKITFNVASTSNSITSYNSRGLILN